MTLIRDLIDIPTQVQDGDFVLKLTQGIGDNSANETIDNYVVTDQLAGAFDQALGLVASAVSDSSSKATFLQGSFGSGKSHFMAMLHLLLSHNTHARSKAELHGAVAKHSHVLDGKNFLLVPVHFLDATSMEQKILGGYVDIIQTAHPDSSLPGVYLGDEIVSTELPKTREQHGDDKFLELLNGTAGSDDEWGDFGSTWTTATLDAALAAPATAEARQDLVAAYIAAFRQGTVLESASTGRGFIDLDRGLAAISTHAQSLGYAGVVLFLDELILWLASNIGNLDFVQRESQKLTKLVEATDAGRPVPIISFIARQRDLRDLVGANIGGEQQKSFSDNLELQQGRFGKIELASGNLPVVARQRLLRPVDDEASNALRAAVDQSLAGREDVKRMLLGSDADIEMFRTVYPFSPALVQALVDVSEALQRERTALKVMLQLLVDQRDDLEVGQIIPVGDLWDVVAGRDEPFSSELKTLFETAKKLWREKLEPALRAINNIDDSTPADALERRALATDARLMKTVLLASLVPEVEAFRGLDAERLAALNWGSINTPIPGTEGQDVAAKLRRINGRVGELILSNDISNPTVGLRLANVDTDDIIKRATDSFDNQGTRKLKLRELIARSLQDRIGADLRGTFNHIWRGSERQVDVVFGNVRDTAEIADHALAAEADRPKLVIDFPFDQSGKSPDDDLERLDAWTDAHDPSHTVCWLPSFFNNEGLTALRNYVAVDEVLKLDRFEQHTSHLSASQRAEAKPIIENLRNQLAAQLSEAILSAYGVVNTPSSFVDTAHSLTQHYRSLAPAVSVRPTTEPSMSGALGQLCDQIFTALYPGHPHFDSKVTTAQLRTTWAEAKRALADDDGRVVVESGNRPALRNVANALQLGTMHESHFQLDDFWRNKLDRHLADATSNDGTATVGDMRAWIDAVPGGPRGLDAKVADLVIATVAAQSDHRLTDHGAAVEPDFSRPLPSDTRIVREELPTKERWAAAAEQAAIIFGITVSQRVNGPEVASLARQAKAKANDLATPAEELVARCSEAYSTWGLPSGDRLDTAMAARDLVLGLKSADDAHVVELLASFSAPTSREAIAKSLSNARTVAAALSRANLSLWNTARPAVETAATDALTSDEIVTAFEPAEQTIEAQATRYVSTITTQPPAEAPVPTTTPTPSATSRTIASEADLNDVFDEVRQQVQANKTITVTWTVEDAT
ncbi:hypothetical protein [Ilumatobacter coccineus]|uniref:Putative phage resistance protein PglY n=1 Tax=Ilumatobacter coccineus (strain NBRC 103263 / KCTC 29153 / YM16-304) TaxID=1313172 RepID=A0A6C7E9Q2_ILUCY|nr:hypothetical protein [Ilumatobacter coccineus]BAN04394.1 putative phage resistance protein PglY [Ilumatobacter coccineus YM16-304]